MGGSTGLGRQLAERIAAADAAEPVEVVIELAGTTPAGSGSRQERIAEARTAFEADLDAVRGTIAAAGGEVLDAAWINRTVRGSVPAGALAQLAADDRVAAIDLPRRLDPDAQASVSKPSP